jgi:hypothetical protein
MSDDLVARSDCEYWSGCGVASEERYSWVCIV